MEARLRAAENRKVPVWRTLRMHMRRWLCVCAPAIYQFRHSAPAHANELRRLLADPEMQALLRQSRYLGDSLKRVCRGLDVAFSLLYPEPDEAPAAMAPEPEPASAPPAENVVSAPPDAAPPDAGPPDAAPASVAPPSAKMGAPDEQNQFSESARVPAPPAAAGDAPTSQTRPGAPAKGDFFKFW